MAQTEITPEERKILLKSQQGELDAVEMYNALARTVRDIKDAETFRQLAEEEGGPCSRIQGYDRSGAEAPKNKGGPAADLVQSHREKTCLPHDRQGRK